MLHGKPQASILLGIDLTVGHESYYLTTTISTQFLSDRSQHVMLSVVGVNWLTLCHHREVFWITL